MKKSDLKIKIEKQLKDNAAFLEEFNHYVALGHMKSDAIDLNRLAGYGKTLEIALKDLNKLPDDSENLEGNEEEQVIVRAQFRKTNVQIDAVIKAINNLMHPVLPVRNVYGLGSPVERRLEETKHAYDKAMKLRQSEADSPIAKFHLVLEDVGLSQRVAKLQSHKASFQGLVSTLTSSLKVADTEKKLHAYETALVALEAYKTGLIAHQKVVDEHVQHLEKAEEQYQLQLESRDATVAHANEVLQQPITPDVESYLKQHPDPSIAQLIASISNNAAEIIKEHVPLDKLMTSDVLKVATQNCRADVVLLSSLIATYTDKINTLQKQADDSVQAQMITFNHLYDSLKATPFNMDLIKKLKEDFDDVVADPKKEKLPKLIELYSKLTTVIRRELERNIRQLELSRITSVKDLQNAINYKIDARDRRVIDELNKFIIHIDKEHTEPTLQGLISKYVAMQAVEAEFQKAMTNAEKIKAAYDNAATIKEANKVSNLVTAVNSNEDGEFVLRALGFQYENRQDYIDILESQLANFNDMGLKNVYSYITNGHMANTTPITNKLRFIEILKEKNIPYRDFLSTKKTLEEKTKNDDLINAVVRVSQMGLKQYITADTLSDSFLPALKILDMFMIATPEHVEALLKDPSKCDVIWQQWRLNEAKNDNVKKVSEAIRLGNAKLRVLPHLQPLQPAQLKTLFENFLKVDPNVSNAVNKIRIEMESKKPPQPVDDGVSNVNNMKKETFENDCNPMLLLLVQQSPEIQELVNNKDHRKSNIIFLSNLFTVAGQKTSLTMNKIGDTVIEMMYLDRLLKNANSLISNIITANETHQCYLDKSAIIMERINRFVDENISMIDDKRTSKNAESCDENIKLLRGFRKECLLILLSSNTPEKKHDFIDQSAKKHFDELDILDDIIECIKALFNAIFPTKGLPSQAGIFSKQTKNLNDALLQGEDKENAKSVNTNTSRG